MRLKDLTPVLTQVDTLKIYEFLLFDEKRIKFDGKNRDLTDTDLLEKNVLYIATDHRNKDTMVIVIDK